MLCVEHVVIVSKVASVNRLVRELLDMFEEWHRTTRRTEKNGKRFAQHMEMTSDATVFTTKIRLPIRR